jgi:hypothetical protein
MSLDITLLSIEVLICDCGKKHIVKNGYNSYQSNITHNLGSMAEAAGIYQALWHPEEIPSASLMKLMLHIGIHCRSYQVRKKNEL